jgi:hypothetical protein
LEEKASMKALVFWKERDIALSHETASNATFLLRCPWQQSAAN